MDGCAMTCIIFYSTLSSRVRRIPWRRVRLPTPLFMGFLVSQTIKNLPAMWKTRVRSLGREDTLEKEVATHSSILAWRIPWMEEPGRLQSTELQRVGHD